eukprot:g6616.t1
MTMAEVLLRSQEQLKVLDQVTVEDVQSEHQRLFLDAFSEALVTGHADAPEAQRLCALCSLASPENGRPAEAPEEAELPEGRTLWVIPGTNPEDGAGSWEERNNCVVMELQLPDGLQQSVFTSLLVRMLNPKVFEDLRTKQQLGYIVQLSNLEGKRFLKLRLLVQTEFEPTKVRARIEACWQKQLRWILEELWRASWFSRHWAELSRRRYDFGRRQKKLEEVRRAELEGFRGFVRQLDLAPRLYIEIHSTQESKALEADAAQAVDRSWEGMEAAYAFRSTASWRDGSSQARSKL